MSLQDKNIAITALLAAFCLVMAGVVVMEWLNPPRQDENLGVTVQQVQEPAPDIEPSAILEVPSLSRYSEIVERPLFLSDRRPPEEQPDVVVEEVPDEPPEFILLGVLVAPERTVALLQDQTGGTARVTLGETLKGWEFSSARANGITLRKSESVIELPLVRNRPVSERIEALSRRKEAEMRRRTRGNANANPNQDEGGRQDGEEILED